MRADVGTKHCNWSLSRPHAWVSSLCFLTRYTSGLKWQWKASVLQLSLSTLKALAALSTETRWDLREVQASPPVWASPWQGWPASTRAPAASPQPRQIWLRAAELGGIINQKDSCVLESECSDSGLFGILLNIHQSTAGCTAWSSQH